MGRILFTLTTLYVFEHAEPEVEIDTRAFELIGVYISHCRKIIMHFLDVFDMGANN